MVVGLIAQQSDAFNAQDPGRLIDHSVEDSLRRGSAGNESCHAPQSGLLLRQQAQLAPRLGVRDRRCHQLRELPDLRLRLHPEGIGLP